MERQLSFFWARVTLIKATLSNLHTYYLSFSKFLRVWPPKLSSFKSNFYGGQAAFKPHYIKCPFGKASIMQIVALIKWWSMIRRLVGIKLYKPLRI